VVPTIVTAAAVYAVSENAGSVNAVMVGFVAGCAAGVALGLLDLRQRELLPLSSALGFVALAGLLGLQSLGIGLPARLGLAVAVVAVLCLALRSILPVSRTR
jgi:hypothetical protein